MRRNPQRVLLGSWSSTAKMIDNTTSLESGVPCGDYPLHVTPGSQLGSPMGGRAGRSALAKSTSCRWPTISEPFDVLD